MNADFPRILMLLRKEKGISQKNAAAELSISQALLSHYEKGIRECGLDFLVRCANFYGVSCDYLLGRTPDRQGSTITVGEIPDGNGADKENRSVHTMLAVLNKKLIINTISILYDLLGRAGNKSLVGEVSSFLMLALYRMFRVIYQANPKNQEALFNVPVIVGDAYADSAMSVCAANAAAIAKGQAVQGMESLGNARKPAISTQSLGEEYPQYASSLLNLIHTCETRIGFKDSPRK